MNEITNKKIVFLKPVSFADIVKINSKRNLNGIDLRKINKYTVGDGGGSGGLSGGIR